MVVIFQNGFNISVSNYRSKNILVFKYTFSGPRIRENNLKYVSKWSDICWFYRSIDLFANHCHVKADKICMAMLFRGSSEFCKMAANQFTGHFFDGPIVKNIPKGVLLQHAKSHAFIIKWTIPSYITTSQPNYQQSARKSKVRGWVKPNLGFFWGGEGCTCFQQRVGAFGMANPIFSQILHFF